MTAKRLVLFISVFFGLFVLAGFVGGFALSGRMTRAEPTLSAAPVEQSPSVQRSTAALPIAGALPDLSVVAEAALKASANISSTTLQRVNNPFFEMWTGQQQFERAQSLGSGVVVSPDGYVLTNTHVIGDEGAEVKVTLQDGRERPGRVVGIDDVTDLAVIKVDAQNLQTLAWGDSSKLRVAEWVLAIGNPFQLSGTVTLGIVSTVSRSGSQVGGYSDFVQTDAAINPGNSGGALVNARGELIGINTLIFSESGGNQGIGFAIPSNRARKIMDELIQTGSVAWGSLGPVRFTTMNAGIARQYDLSQGTGVLAHSMPQGAPAARAGLQNGDIVVSFNGQKVESQEQLERLVKDAKIGSVAKLGVVRYRSGGAATIEIPVTNRASQTGRLRR
jgi:serine protease Do